MAGSRPLPARLTPAGSSAWIAPASLDALSLGHDFVVSRGRRVVQPLGDHATSGVDADNLEAPRAEVAEAVRRIGLDDDDDITGAGFDLFPIGGDERSAGANDPRPTG